MESNLLLPQEVIHPFSNQWSVVKSYFTSQTRLVQYQYEKTGAKVLMNWRRLTSRVQQKMKNCPAKDDRKKTNLIEFEDRFEALIDLLCLTAHEGVRADRQKTYASSRVWMCRNYPRVRKFIQPYLQVTMEAEDPFKQLFLPKRIDEVINSELCIDRITSSRFALQECLEALNSRPFEMPV